MTLESEFWFETSCTQHIEPFPSDLAYLFFFLFCFGFLVFHYRWSGCEMGRGEGEEGRGGGAVLEQLSQP